MPDNSLIQIIRHYYTKLKTFLFSKNALSFLLFLLLSTSFWFVNSLDKKREITIHVPVRFVGIPKDIVISNALPIAISLTLKDEGIQLFSYSKDKLKPLYIDIKNDFSQHGVLFITSSQLNKELKSYLLPSSEIQEIKPDSISLKYEKLSSKTVPVQLVSKIQLEPQYMFSNKIIIEPATIKIYGKKNELDSIIKVQTEILNISKLEQSTERILKLKPISGLIFDQDSVKINLSVEMFTEKTIDLPVITLNCPNYLNVRTFPAMVKATFNIGVSKFNLLKNNDLQIILDYNDLLLNKSGRHKLNIVKNSSLITNIRIVPDEVEYLLEEKQ